MSQLKIRAGATDRLRRPWKQCTTLGRAYDGLRKDVNEHLSYLQREIGFLFIRFHALFHDDMGVVKRA